MRARNEWILAAGALGFALAFPIVLLFAVQHAHAASIYSQDDHSVASSYTFPQSYTGVANPLFSYVAPTSGHASTTWLYAHMGSASNGGNCNEGAVVISINGSSVGSFQVRTDGISGYSCPGFGPAFTQGTQWYAIDGGYSWTAGDTITISGEAGWGLSYFGDKTFYGATTGIPGQTNDPTYTPNIYPAFVIDSTATPGPTPPAPPVIPTTTSIALLTPEQATTTPSNTIAITATVDVGTDLASNPPNRIGVELIAHPTFPPGPDINYGIDWSVSTTSGEYTYATSTTLASGDWTLYARLYGDLGTYDPGPGCVSYPPFTNCAPYTNTIQYGAASFHTFAVATSTFEPTFGFDAGSTTSQIGLATTTCSIGNIAGCFQNAIVFIFYPPPTLFDWIASIWAPLKTKPPFGYFTIVANDIGGLTASTTPTYTLNGAGLFADEIFTPIRTGLAVVLVISFLVGFYRLRLKNLDL